MGPRLRIGTVAATAAFAMATVCGGSALSAAPGCGRFEERTATHHEVAADRSAVLYDDVGDLWACYRPTGKTSLIIPTDDGTYWFKPPALALAGPVFAVAFDGGEGNSSSQIATGDLSFAGDPFSDPLRRRILAPAAGDGFVRYGSVRVSRDAAVAWIQCPFVGENPATPPHSAKPNCTKPGRSVNRVYKVDASGSTSKPVLLDRSRGIDPRSLTLKRGVLHWTRSGHSRTSLLK